MVNPNSIVYHVGGGTLDSSSPFKTYLNFRNNLFMLFKNLPAIELVKTVFIRLILDGAAALKFISQRKGLKHVLAILRAHVVFYLTIPHLILKRQKINQCSALSGKYERSILYKYYFKDKKKYSEL
jgi:hypothetical protein